MVGRRGFLLAAAGATAQLAAGCGRSTSPRPVPPGPAADAAELDAMLSLEHRSAALYAASARALRGGAAAMALEFRDQEEAHVERLRTAIRDLGATPGAPPGTDRVSRPRSAPEALRRAEALEAATVAAYLDRLPRLEAPELRALVASIVAVEAEQITVLRGALGRAPLADAFVTGEA